MSATRPQALVRPAAPADASGAADLLSREARFAHRLDPYFELSPDFDWPGLVQRLLARPDVGLFVAEQEGDLAGLVYARVIRPRVRPRTARRSWLRRFLRPQPPPPPRPAGPLEPAVWGVIESCWVEIPARRRGIGRQLVARAEHWLRDQGAQRLRLGVAAGNQEARQFWQELGFRPYRVRYLREL